MDSPANTKNTATVLWHVTRWALVVGAICFVAGLVIPVLISTSNLAPLISIVIAGPVGITAGVVLGTISATRRLGGSQPKVLLGSLVGAWCLALLYTLFTAKLAARLVIPAIGLQLFVLGAASYLLYYSSLQNALPTSLRRSRPLVLAVMLLAIVGTTFPPVRPPTARAGAAQAAALMPERTFILDRRLDASRHVPSLVISERHLMAEWVIVLLIFGTVGLFVERFRDPRLREQ